MANQIGKLEVGVRLKVDDNEVQALRRSLSSTGDAASKAIDKGLSNKLGQLGTNATRAGRQITFGLSLPAAAAGKAATDTYLRFDSAMTRIHALVGVSAEQTAQWGDEVKRIGSTYGQTADETANALYFIASSGFEGAKAMDILETSAKASAVGLGNVQGMASVLTSALTAYASDNLTAANAADILTVAVREGKAEADEMGSALASVIAPASTLGISFGELAGAMASMTLTGSTPDEVATQLGALMSTLTDMPPIAQRALKAYTGMEYETLRLNLANKGLVPTLESVFDAFEGNEAAMSEVFGNIRAWRGVMNLFGDNAANTTRIISETTNATGDLGSAMDKTAQSASFRMEKAMADLNIAMTELGATIAPVATTVVEKLTGVAQWLSDLPGPAKTAAVGLGVVTAAAGPLVYSFGAMIQVANGATKVFKRIGPPIADTARRLSDHVRLNAMYRKEGDAAAASGGRLGLAMGALGGAIVVATVAWQAWNDRVQKSKAQSKTLGDIFRKAAGRGGIGAARDTIAKTRKEIEGINADIANLSWYDVGKRASLEEMAAGLGRNVAAMEAHIRMAGRMAKQSGLNADALFNWLITEENLGRTYRTAAEAMDAHTRALAAGDAAAQQVKDTTDALKGTFGALIAEVQATSDVFFGAFDAEKKYADALRAVRDANKAVTDAEKDHATAKKATVDATRRVAEAQERQEAATKRLAEANKDLTSAQAELNEALKGPSEDITLDIESAALAVEEARRRLRDLGKTKPGEKREPVDPLERRRAQIDVRRAELDHQRALAEQDKRVAEAREKVADAEQNVVDATSAEQDAAQAVVDARDAKADASQREADALDKIAEMRDKVRDAELAAVPAATDYAAKQEAIAAAFANGTFQAGPFLEYLTKIKDMFPELSGVLDDYIIRLGVMASLNSKPGTPNTATPPPGTPPAVSYEEKARAFAESGGAAMAPIFRGMSEDDIREFVENWWETEGKHKRERGGPVRAGGIYTVNEAKVPELFSAGGRQYLMPLSNGRVTPLDATVPVRGGDQPGMVIEHLEVKGQDRPHATAAAIGYELRKRTYLKGGR